MQTIGFVGLGAMGSRMAANLLRAGYVLRVHNRDASRVEPLVAAGATACASPAEVARGAAAVVAMVSDDAASQAVIGGPEGVLAGISAGAVIIDSTTVTPGHARALAAAAAARNCGFLDAPVLGSLVQVENRELVFIVGGEAGAFEKGRPVMEAMGRMIRHVGPSGAGATIKLINNMVSGTLTAVLAEAACVAERAGVDTAAVFDIINEGASGSRMTRGKLPKIFNRDFTPQFQLSLMAKDLRYFSALAQSLGQAMPVSASAAEVYRQASEAGLGALDSCAVFRHVAGDRR